MTPDPSSGPSSDASSGSPSAVDERPFALELPDGEIIRGEVRRPAGKASPETAVVVVHGFKGFRRWGFFPHVCRRLARAGHGVVSFDFSRNGVGPGGEHFDELEAFARNTFTRELDELARVVDALRAGRLVEPDAPGSGPPQPALGEFAPHRVGLLGHSRGGGTAVLASAEEGDQPSTGTDVDALVTWAAVATFDRWDDQVKAEWRRAGRIHVRNARTGQDMPLNVTLLDDLEAHAERLDVESAAGRVRVPWLIVHGGEDASVPTDEAHRLKGAADARLAFLHLVEGAGHTFGASHPMEGAPHPHLAEALDATLAHLARHLPGPMP